MPRHERRVPSPSDREVSLGQLLRERLREARAPLEAARAAIVGCSPALLQAMEKVER